MYRVVSFIVIFTFVSVMLIFHFRYGHSPFFSHADDHHDERIEIPDHILAPVITGEVKQDFSGTWYLHIETNHFTFSPENVGLNEINYREGHAHLYINGKKINRLYGEYYNLGKLKNGKHHIQVTLNANNHGIFTHKGNPIMYEEIIEVSN